MGLDAQLHLLDPGVPSPAQGCAATVSETVSGLSADESPNGLDARGKRVFSGTQQVEEKCTLHPHVGKLFLTTLLSFKSCQETLASFQGTVVSGVHNDSNPSNSGRKPYVDDQQESNWRVSVTLQHSYLNLPRSGLVHTQVSPVGLHFLQKPDIPTPDFAPPSAPHHPSSPAQPRSSLSSLLMWVLSRPRGAGGEAFPGSAFMSCVSGRGG